MRLLLSRRTLSALYHRTRAFSTQPSRNETDTWFSNLRWQAANALTASLTGDERNKLLKELSPEQEKEEIQAEPQEQQPSIAELMAKAKAEEARKYEAQWEKQKEMIMKEAEEAAQRRVEYELKVREQRQQQFDSWKAQVQQERATNAAVEESRSVPEHTVLGPALCDLGYKRVHLVSVNNLQNIPVWKKQRIYRHDRAQAMAADKRKTMHLGLPGVIGLYQSEDGSLSILDGQHRVGMLSLLENDDLGDVLVEVFPQQNDNMAQELFEEINKAEPVKLLDMPGVAKASDRKALTDGAARLHARYPDMFSTSQRCRAPHVNIDNLRDALFGARVLAKHGLKTGKALEAWLEGQNVLMKEKYAADEKLRSSVSKQAWTKVQKFDFYLGLDSSWLYN